MKPGARPAWWDDDDATIAQLLDCSPVPGSARHAAHQYLLKSIAAAEKDIRHSLVNATNCPELTVENPLHSPALPPRSAYRRRWLGLSAMAACTVLGLFWWSSSTFLTAQQLVSTCSEQLSQADAWEVFHDQVEQSELSVLTDALRKYLRSSPSGGMETMALVRTEVSPRGRVWRIPVSGGSELYVFVFHAPRSVQNLDQQLKFISDLSQGWSSAAVATNDGLLVFMSKDDLRKSLRFMPLA